MLATWYHAFMEFDFVTWGCPQTMDNLKDQPAHEASLELVESIIRPEQEGVLLWMIKCNRLPRSAALVSNNSAQAWSDVALLDQCYAAARAARSDRRQRLLKSKTQWEDALTQSQEAEKKLKSVRRSITGRQQSSTDSATEEDSGDNGGLRTGFWFHIVVSVSRIGFDFDRGFGFAIWFQFLVLVSVSFSPSRIHFQATPAAERRRNRVRSASDRGMMAAATAQRSQRSVERRRRLKRPLRRVTRTIRLATVDTRLRDAEARFPQHACQQAAAGGAFGVGV